MGLESMNKRRLVEKVYEWMDKYSAMMRRCAVLEAEKADLLARLREFRRDVIANLEVIAKNDIASGALTREQIRMLILYIHSGEIGNLKPILPELAPADEPKEADPDILKQIQQPLDVGHLMEVAKGSPADEPCEDEHLLRHQALHKYLDELIADYITNTKGLPSKNTILDLMNWSYDQTIPCPECGEEEK